MLIVENPVENVESFFIFSFITLSMYLRSFLGFSYFYAFLFPYFCLGIYVFDDIFDRFF